MLLNIGLDPRRLISLRDLPKYVAQYNRFKTLGGAITHRYAILSDYDDQAGAASGHYFHQDLLVASFIHKTKPQRHIDIGSRIDGFIAHVASFRKVDVMDIRDLNSTGHQNISFFKADLMKEDNALNNITDSISCLHAIEHFGLGRYGDPLDPTGHRKAFNNILRMLKTTGTLYVSFPIGKSNEVHFNAHRVFHPKDIFSWAEDGSSLRLERFDYVDDAGSLHQNVDMKNMKLDVSFGCGIYTFQKLH
jgi:Caenorhabditis protein of unknown function, DUF268